MISQEQRDLEAARVNCKWLEPCKKSREWAKIECLNCNYKWEKWPTKVKQGQGCPKCAHKVRAYNRRTSQEQRNQEAANVNCKWIEPYTTCKALTKIECLLCKHQWSVVPDSIKRGTGCPMCAPNGPVFQKQRDEEAAAVNCKWLEPYSGNHILTKIQCLICDYAWRASPGNIHMGRGCPLCARHGSDCSLSPSLIYLLKDFHGAAKIGITREGSNRISKHKSKGWKFVKSWSVSNRASAYKIEQSVLHWWRNELNLHPVYKNLDGWTETVDVRKLSLDEICLKIDNLLLQIEI
jgi:hypothetical protein